MSGPKADLILRAYAIFSRLKQQVEPEISSLQLLQTTDEIACTYEDVFKLKCSHLPWTSDLRGTPAFSFIQLYDYLVIRTTKFKHIMLKSTRYKKLKSLQFFYEGYIKRIDVAKDSNFTFFDVRMKASMKSTLYIVLLVLDRSGIVSCAACTCPAGAGISGLGNCNHVGGVLFALEDFNRKGYKNCPEPVSCTSKLAAWNFPSSFASVSPASFDEVLIKKIRFGKDDVQLKAIKNICHDPRKIAHRRVDEERVEKLKHSLASSIPNSCFFAFHSFPDTSSASSSSIVTEMVESLDSPFQDSFVNLSVSDTDSNSMAFSDDYDISCSNFKDMMDYHTKNNMYLPSTAILDIEKETRGQSSNSSWKQHRLYRITASNFYSAAVTTVEPSSKLNSMFYSSFSSVRTRHGKAYESHVRSLYLETLLRNGFNKVFVDVPGLIVSSTHSFLGASLDGIVKHGEDSWGLEIKCPYSKFSSSLHDAVADKKFFLRKADVVGLKKIMPITTKFKVKCFALD